MVLLGLVRGILSVVYLASIVLSSGIVKILFHLGLVIAQGLVHAVVLKSTTRDI